MASGPTSRTVSLPRPTQNGVALITGASSGIGACFAGELAARGHGLVLVARRKERLDALAEELRATHGVLVETIAADLAKPASRGRLPGTIKRKGLEVEVLVNNAGFATQGPFDKSDSEREVEQVRLLVENVVVLTRVFVEPMVERRRGAILNVASVAGMQPLPYAAGYSAAKAYVLTFSEALHHELRRHGITVTALAPGPVSTDFWEISGWELTGQEFERAVPGPAWVSAEHAARAGIEGLESGSRVVIPSLRVRTAMQASRYIPHALKLPTIERAMRRR